MDHQIKAQVLKDIMKAMLARQGGKLQPKAASLSVETTQPPPGQSPLPTQAMAHGGIVEDPEGHAGEEGDLSEDDHKILSSLWGEGDTSHDTSAHDQHNSHEHESEEDPDEDEEAGYE